jgi:uncharacterized protein
MWSILHDADRRELLKLARHVVVHAVENSKRMKITPPAGVLGEPSGAFVTLRIGKRLRGCIGRLEAEEPLARIVADCAYSAAMNDPRFRPVTAEELPELEIELSVLSAPARISAEEVQAGVHGLIVTRGHRRGVLLPQVAAEYHWSAERFLEETCVKSGLPPGAWRESDTLIEGFTADVFSESDFAAPDAAAER